MDEINEVENKYAHLLQPIRDLAENWNIDIANELEEYLGELEKITFTFDEGGKTLNFAEAALLIQGSACIYSKKVEYLYQLLYKTLEFLAEKKRKQHNTSISADGVDKDATQDEGPEFLTLDDIEEADNIDLIEDDESSSKRGNTSVNSSSLALIIARQNTEEQSGIGSKRNDFRVNTCTVHKTGALLLEEKDRLDLDETLSRPQSKTTSAMSTPARPTAQPFGSMPDSQNVSRISAIGDNIGMGISMGMGFGAADSDSDDERPAVAEFTINQAQQPAPGTMVTSSNVGSPHQIPVANKPARRGRKKNVTFDDEEEYLDLHWKTLDPHEPPLASQLKPFKKGKTYRMPEGIEDPNKKGKKKTEPKITEESTNKSKKKETVEDRSLHLRGAFFPEFDYIYTRIMKTRQQERRKFKEDLLAQTFNSFHASNAEIAAAVEQQAQDDDDDDDRPAEFISAFGGGMDSDDDEIHPEPIALDVPLHEDSQMSTQSFEDFYKTKIESYLASAAQAVQETSLGLRIADWTRRITPVLEEQDKRTGFHIHEYGDIVMNRFKREGEEISLKQLFNNNKEASYEVCRDFAAVLQLANFGNVEIIKHGKAINTASFKLVTTKKVMDIANYRAPSTRPEDEEEEHEEEEEEQTEEVVQPKKKGKSKKASSKKKKGDIGKENVKNMKRTAEIAV